jgi:hypothetical protein
MKRCPSCNRTYTDDRMMNCAHDGAPLMSAAYSPQGGPPTPQGYPPPPPGYPQPGAPWQNYPPPPGYPPQQYYPQQPGWPQAGMSEYVACPRCMRPDPEQVKFTWWGGVIGPKMFKHVKCRQCGLAYNGKTGQSNTTNIVIYSIVVFVIFLGIGILIFSMR